MSDIFGWSPVAAAKKLGGEAEGAGKAVNNALGDVLGTPTKAPLVGAAKAVDDSAPAQAVDSVVGGITGGGGKGKTATPPDVLSTKGLKEGTNYTYKNGKLVEYTPPAAVQNYGFDPLSMKSIMTTAIDPELAALNKQSAATDKSSGAALNGDLAQDAALGIPQSALDLIKTGYAGTTAAENQNLGAQETGAIAGAPLDALITQLGQASDAARLAGYEAEYGDSTSGSGSSTAGSTALAQILAASQAGG
jgi:hypothetical protein